jgi:hypothetical protein
LKAQPTGANQNKRDPLPCKIKKPMKKLFGFFAYLFSIKIRNKTNATTNHYKELINEYGLIMEKKSTLPKADRDRIVLEVWALIKKGHIVLKKMKLV